MFSRATILALVTIWVDGYAFRKPLDYGRVMRVINKRKPYGGLIYFHLLLDGLERAGHLRAEAAAVNLQRARTSFGGLEK